ncbi:MAG: MBL fold metallo-hydrolase [Rhodocyclaceae bacterium]
MARRHPGRTALGALLIASFLVGCMSKNPYYDPAKAHHRPDGFVNSSGSPLGSDIPAWEILLRNMRGDFKPKSLPEGGYEAFAQRWSVPLDAKALAVPPQGRRVTWLGHASVLLQLGAINVLTDPVFSDRAGPTSWLGARRRVPAPIQAEALPRLDVVLISHNHYDHLDDDTVRRIHAAQGDAPLWVVPLGLKPWLAERGVTHVRELDWWDTVDAAGLTIALTPAQHWSKRTVWDANASLWGGFLVRQGAWQFLYTGDTGYSNDFVEIGRRFGAIDLLAVPIGAYEPRDFMRRQHVNPAESVRIAQDVHAKQAIGVHWGTFELTQEAFDAPPRDLAAAVLAANLPSDTIRVLRHGESLVLDH